MSWALADGYRAELVRAARKGLAFAQGTGEPESWATADGPRNRSLCAEKPVTQDHVTGFDLRERVAGVGFEPTKAEPTVLQTAAIRSLTCGDVTCR